MGDEKRNEMMTAREVEKKLLSIEREYIDLTNHLKKVFESLNGLQKNEILEKMQCLISHRNALLSIRRENRKIRRASLLPNIIRKG